jgi:hypothetical protein
MPRLRCSKATCLVFVGALLFALSISVPARAGLVTDYVTFSATGFTAWGAPSDIAPYTTVTGAFTVTFDPSANYPTGTTTGISLDYLNSVPASTPIPLDYPLGFEYTNNGDFTAGGYDNGGLVDIINAGLNNFGITILSFNTTPTVFLFGYTQQGYGGEYLADQCSVTVTPTPLPPSLLLFGTGLLRLAGYRKKRLV